MTPLLENEVWEAFRQNAVSIFNMSTEFRLDADSISQAPRVPIKDKSYSPPVTPKTTPVTSREPTPEIPSLPLSSASDSSAESSDDNDEAVVVAASYYGTT